MMYHKFPEYYGIGEKRLRQIAGENEGADFILEVGSHIRLMKKAYELGKEL